MPVVAGTPYAVRADLAALGLLSGALSNVPTGTQDAALLAASGVADSYLQSQYTLPLTSWGYDLLRAVCIIAAYDLMTSRGYNPVGNVDQNIRLRYLDVIAWLEGIASGEETPASVVDSGSGSGSSSFSIRSSAIRGWTHRDTDEAV
jgi:phage gp36-like protein